MSWEDILKQNRLGVTKEQGKYLIGKFTQMKKDLQNGKR